MNVLRIGHSPDPDDAFMFFALAHGYVRIEGYQIEHVLEDIESLNRRAMQGELEATAISAATYPSVAKTYRPLSVGASMGVGYGPVLVNRKGEEPVNYAGCRVAIPGRHTTAYLLLRLYLEDFDPVEVPFDQIPQEVLEGKVDAGLLIHEGQLTHPQMGLQKVLDLGERWREETGLPLPLGLDVVHRGLDLSLQREISKALRQSIEYAFSHEEEAIDYALRFGRGLDRETCRRFVRMYVNEYTGDMGEEGRRALSTLYEKAHARGLIPTVPDMDPVPWK